MRNQTQNKPSNQRTSTQICVSFGMDETALLDILDKERHSEHLTRSGWIKQKIRESYVPQHQPKVILSV